MSVDQIVSTLQTLEKMHKSLLELALRKTECVKAGDMALLNELLKNEQSHVAAIEKLELKRQIQVQSYIQAKHLTIEHPPSISELIDLTTDIDDRQKLQQIRARLVSLLEQLKKQNDLNQKLVFQSLQFVNMSLEMMRPQQAQVQTMNYSGQEVRGEGQVNKKSYFDSQA